MSSIIVATLAVAVIGMLIGILLVTVDKKFKVEVDEKQVAIRECLPGNNCGGCGYAGCDALASAIANQEAPVNACPVGGDPVAEKISRLLGLQMEKTEKVAAYVKCSGDCENAAARCRYVGIHDCASAASSGLSTVDLRLWLYRLWHLCFRLSVRCNYRQSGCCKRGPFQMQGRWKMCCPACPRHLIELVPESAVYAVRCSSHDRGAAVKKVCKAGCLACKLCEKQCESGAITVENNVAHIDYEKCTKCGKCAEKCPAGVIRKKDVS